MEALIKGGAALDATGKGKWNDGWTALHFAALSPRARWSGAGLARTRLTLIGAFLTLSDCVALEGKTECARLLIESGADLSLKTNDGRTALDIATPSGTTTNSPPAPNRTPPPAHSSRAVPRFPNVAERHGYTEIVQMLEEAAKSR